MDPLSWAYENFDTSERAGDTREPSHYECAPATLLTPVITLVFSNGIKLVVTDTGRVLNTGGVDRFACFGSTEATPWTAVAPADVARTP